ncbi:16S rRNA (cytosine967-C5)-methyltransferase [Spiroplasma chinense]|uniref:16S rRNA (Cytosine967-C5)-methyltransferase n=1 Tax=Spiroplasma chinense TaxID=216932 RepID=A0A5B9Y5G2_9MOLU|nr:16S rRNA (cytosine(967)-C(5))-methyltransferase RsmB [Spiroplasma chinense]QEH62190.1 16S rRNA (cytosine967-C5)-methyltransferase [Spiroplasma chinense]
MNARKKALDILYEVFENNQFSNKLLNKMALQKAMSKQDIAFIFKLVYGTIQYKIYLEYVVNKLIDPNKTNFKIQILLWMSFYQIKFLETPIYSVVNEAVEISKKIDSHLSGFVNSVLKKIQDKTLWNVDIKNKQNVLALENGFPFWLYKQIANQYGSDNADKLVLDSIKPVKISFRVNENLITIEDFVKLYQDELELEKSKIARNCFFTSNKLFESNAFKEGLVYIQDETSILAVELLNPKPNSKIVDMCCAPGGKLTYIASLVGKDTKVLGCEINSSKENIIRKNIESQKLENIDLVFKDATTLKENSFDYILLDAPCSGYGVLKRKPEIKLKKRSKQEIEELLKVQKELLITAYNLMDEGATLLYSTCTVNKDENQNQVENLLNNFKDLELIEEKQFFGFEGNNNGFYIAKIFKKINL